ncbi:hypothetical protein F2Q69_00019186 [Brassica cretica]|uniref:Uncharacterized protein n=1 Tax=Brassica cretica TaxID=69181 RepID=A0A8S9QHQ8_BRACR|nr:hypothetical protein F2Q69_00019186 [Brassica cretica]
MRQSDQLFFDEFTSPSMKATNFLGFDKTLLEQQSALGNGGSLIVSDDSFVMVRKLHRLGFDKTLLEQQSALGNGGSLIDPWCIPAVEEQAVMCIHCIGPLRKSKSEDSYQAQLKREWKQYRGAQDVIYQKLYETSLKHDA